MRLGWVVGWQLSCFLVFGSGTQGGDARIHFGISSKKAEITALALSMFILRCFSWIKGLLSFAMTIYVNNEGVRGNLIKCTSRRFGIAVRVARFWRLAAVQRWGGLGGVQGKRCVSHQEQDG